MDEVLRIMYDELKRKLRIDKKLYQDSVVLSFLNIKSNTRLGYLIDTAFDIAALRGKDQVYLRQGLIKSTGVNNKYCLTVKTIWNIESEWLNEDFRLVDYLENKYFDCPNKSQKLTDKEKVIIFSMIMGRPFSFDDTMNLKLDDSYINKWEDIILNAYDILSNTNTIEKLSKTDLFGAQGNEHKVSKLIRHTDALPKKCNMLFKAAGKQKYYLDISSDSEDKKIDSEKLLYILNLIFENPDELTLEETDRLASECISNAHEIGIYTTEQMNPFISIANDKIIEICFEKISDPI